MLCPCCAVCCVQVLGFGLCLCLAERPTSFMSSSKGDHFYDSDSEDMASEDCRLSRDTLAELVESYNRKYRGMHCNLYI